MPGAPGMNPMAGDHVARSQVAGPAIALMVVSACTFLWYLFAFVMVIFAGSLSFLGVGASAGDPGAAVGMGMGAAIYLFFALAAAVTFVGALRMKSLKNYGLGVTSAVLAILPCTTYICCMFTMPLGIWALIVLLKPEVKAEFS